ncbi:hypothetical protein ABTY53_13230 [Streptomyces noursei]|uniref:hypothetical protein n=1 Tax=Streptomyces noursei TaxID=1971 RepID=UPI00332AD4EC
MTRPTSPPNELHQQQLKQLATYLRESQRVAERWDAYDEEHTDLDGWPHDDHTYRLRQSQRDIDTVEAFEAIRHDARHLLATAEAQLARLPVHAIQHRWGYQLSVLHTALDHLDTVDEQWQRTREQLPDDARPGAPVFDIALAGRSAASWPCLDSWTLHGHTLDEINSAARHASSPLAPPPPTTTPAPARTPVRNVSVRR